MKNAMQLLCADGRAWNESQNDTTSLCAKIC